MPDKPKHFYEFEEFRLDTGNPSLWRGGKLVSIAPKVLETLILLVEKRGEIVSRDDLMDTVWQDTFVEEGNINYTISLLRKTLGNKEIIQTVARRGYRFTALVRIAEKEAEEKRRNEERETGLNGNEKPWSAVNDLTIPTDADGQPTKDENKNPPSVESPFHFLPFSASPFRFVFAAVLLTLLGFAGFRLWSGQTEKKSFAPLETVNFKKLTFTGDLTFPVLAPDGNSFAFVRDGSLFVQDVNTGDENRLNVIGEKVFGILQFSPDGNSLYFRNRVGFNLAGSVFQVSRFGGNPKLIAENVWSGFGFSSDGKQMSFIRSNPNEAESTLILKNLETGAERKLKSLNLPDEFLDNGHSAWSPDGQKIAVVIFKKLRQTSASELVVVDVESGKSEEIKTPQLRQFEQLAWLPGGNDLIVSARENGKFFQLWRLAYPSGEAQKITNDLNIYRGISLSADGKKLLARQFTLYSHLWIGEKNDLENARQKTFGNLNRDGVNGINWMPNGDILYIARIMGDRDLWLYRPSDDSRRQLTKNAGDLHEHPVASPDGKFIFFNSNRSGANHIWRIDATGANQTQITFGENEVELYPQISPDGGWLYYIQKAATASTVWRKSLADGQTEALTEAGRLAPDSFLSLSPDGKFLAFHNSVEKVNEEGEKHIYQVGVISTDKRTAPKFYSITASRLAVRWSSDGTALDYIENSAEGAKIRQQSLDGNQSPTTIVDLPKAFLHNFAWSANGENLVLSRGQQLNDAILLTNFQP